MSLTSWRVDVDVDVAQDAAVGGSVALHSESHSIDGEVVLVEVEWLLCFLAYLSVDVSFLVMSNRMPMSKMA